MSTLESGGARPRLLLTRCCCGSLRAGVVMVGAAELTVCMICAALAWVFQPRYIFGIYHRQFSILSYMRQFMIHSGAACVLLHAARQRNPVLLWGWLLFRGCELITTGGQMVMLAVLHGDHTALLVLLAVYLVTGYNLLLVRSYRHQLLQVRGFLTSEDDAAVPLKVPRVLEL